MVCRKADHSCSHLLKRGCAAGHSRRTPPQGSARSHTSRPAAQYFSGGQGKAAEKSWEAQRLSRAAAARQACPVSAFLFYTIKVINVNAIYKLFSEILLHFFRKPCTIFLENLKGGWHMEDSGHSFGAYFKRATSPIVVLAIQRERPMYV